MCESVKNRIVFSLINCSTVFIPLTDSAMKSPSQLNMNGFQTHAPAPTYSWPYQWTPNYYTPAPLISNTFVPPIMPVNIYRETFPHDTSINSIDVYNQYAYPPPNKNIP